MPPVDWKIARCRTAIKRIIRDRHTTAATWCHAAGMDKSALRKFLKGHNNSIELPTLFKLAEVYQLTIAEMVGEV
jgi:DNA-binding Xre family transcriptional regulator